MVCFGQKIEHIITLRNSADRNSDISRNNRNNKSTLNTTNVLPNLIIDNISITSTTTSGISPIREENERQNLNDAPSVAEVAKAPRFKIYRKKLEQLLSIGFPVRKIAKGGLLGRKLHRSIVHHFMASNHSACSADNFNIIR